MLSDTLRHPLPFYNYQTHEINGVSYLVPLNNEHNEYQSSNLRSNVPGPRSNQRPMRNPSIEVEPPTDLVHSFYSSAALETQELHACDEEQKIPPPRREKLYEGYGLADLLNKASHQEHNSIDLQEMLMSLVYNRFIPYSVLWPHTNFALSQIREWPSSQKSHEPAWNSDRINNNATNEIRQNSPTIWSTPNDQGNIWSSIPSTNQLSLRNLPTGTMNYSATNDYGLSNIIPGYNIRNNMVTSSGNALKTQIAEPVESSRHGGQHLNPNPSTHPWQDNGLSHVEDTERINQMVAELSVTGVVRRPLPKREEDMKKLQQFRNLKEKGKGGKVNMQQLQNRPLR